jgi:ADP-ribosylglycohydrolase
VNRASFATDDTEIARAILRYLKEHPEAKDTLDGIAQWWLVREWTERRRMEIEGAVALLLSEQLILQTSRTGLPPYYQLNEAKAPEISRILKNI